MASALTFGMCVGTLASAAIYFAMGDIVLAGCAFVTPPIFMFVAALKMRM